MNFSRFACTAVLVFGVAHTATGQTPTTDTVRATGTVGTTRPAPAASIGSAVDVNRLPIDLQRIERRFRQNSIREERNGLNLRYFVEVFAPAPKLVLFTQQDNLEHGQAPYGGPTHNEILQVLTPRYFWHLGGLDILNR